ncbi:MAG: hypothetical protein LUH22_18600 [Bacteroides sp.]|nr:hypothetical protein [Bacteroides sp.]
MKIFIGIVILAIIGIAVFNLNISIDNEENTFLILSNIEALAKCEESITKPEGNSRYKITVCDRTTTWQDKMSGVACATEKKDSECVFEGYYSGR